MNEFVRKHEDRIHVVLSCRRFAICYRSFEVLPRAAQRMAVYLERRADEV